MATQQRISKIIFDDGSELSSMTSATLVTLLSKIVSANLSTVEVAATLRKEVSGTAANGIGAALAFEVENASGSSILGARLDAVVGDVTNDSEDFHFDINLMAAGALAKVFRFSNLGELLPTNIHNNGGTGNSSNQAISSGTYTPTASNISNLDATPTMSPTQWLRVGNIIIVGIRAVVNPTATGLVSFEISLPIVSNFAATTDAIGLMVANDSTAGTSAAVSASVANDTLVFSENANYTGSRTHFGLAIYEVF